MEMISVPVNIVCKREKSESEYGKRIVICRGIVREIIKRTDTDALYDSYE